MSLGFGFALPALRSSGGLGAAVQALFASGEKGVMFDLTSASGLYQDSARTTPVTASGDKIGSVTDLSPNAKHASSLGTARPAWDGSYGTFDAFDDYLQTAAIDFTATDAMTVVIALRKTQSASGGMIAELSASSSANNGTFWVFDGVGAVAGDGLTWRSKGTTDRSPSAVLVAPANAVFTGFGDISADQAIVRINGADAGSNLGDQGTGNFGNYALNIGSRNSTSIFFNGRIYRMLVIGRALTSAERNVAERWAAQPVGITIP